MTFREQSERMFAGVLVAAVLHAALLIGAHKLFDLRFEDYTRPLTVRLLAPETRDVPVREQRPLPPKQEEAAPAVAVPKPAPQPVATPRSAARPQPAPERATAEEPAPVRTQPRTESAPAEASASPVAAWTPALRQSVESAPVRGGGGLNAVTGDTVRQAEPRAGAASSPAFGTQGDLPTTFKDGLALPVEESVWRASSRTPGDSAARGLSSDDSVPVVHDLGRSGRNPDTATAPAPIRTSGIPTSGKADAAGSGTGAAERAVPIDDFAPGAAKQAPVHAEVSEGGAPSSTDETGGVGSQIEDLDRVLSEIGRDGTAGAGQDRGAGTTADRAAEPTGPDVGLPEGWKVTGSLGLRRLVHVVDPALPEHIPAEMAGSELRVWIRANPQGSVRVHRWERNSASMDLNNKITEALRQWRYEPVDGPDPVDGMVTIQIRMRPAEVAAGGS